MTARWQAALGYALTGEVLEVGEPGGPDPRLLLAELELLGWPKGRINAHAQAVGGWPHPVPSELRQGCSAAQFAAVLAQLRELLDLSPTTSAPPSTRHQLDADELRLMREVPPHHVG